LNQGRDNLEHLIIDGNSSDGTQELVRSLEHLKLISEPDEGIYDALNKGIAAATGEWIYFLGADDYFVDERVLSDLWPIFDNDYDVVYGDVMNSRTGKRYDGAFDTTKIRRKNISHQAIFFRRRVFEQVGLFNTAYKSYADWDHNMRWLLDCSIRKKYVDRVIAVYDGSGFSFAHPDVAFRRDRLYRYLTYGRGQLPASLFLALLVKDFGLGIREWDWTRIQRTLSMASGKGEEKFP
jgi:glycosyltransferase involved in cell wall biosynthesis